MTEGAGAAPAAHVDPRGEGASRARLIFERQGLHASLLAVLLVAVGWASALPRVQAGRIWGVGSTAWLWLAVGCAIAHQGFVWFCWRTQLHLSLLTRLAGARAFPLYAVPFALLGGARVVTVIVLATSNRETLPIDLLPRRVLAAIALALGAYVLDSVARHFTFERALGIDHFDARYRSLPLVRQGIFRFTRNGMYTFGLLILWAPGLWQASAAALCAALFQHLYIWVHYCATELPDMRRIYGAEPSRRSSGTP